MENADAKRLTKENFANSRVIFQIIYISGSTGSRMFYYFIVFVLLVAIIGGLFFASYKIYNQMKEKASRAGAHNDPIVGNSSG